jgi:hypothetical protein
MRDYLPFKKLNLVTSPIAVGLAALIESFWSGLGLAAGLGLGIATLMALLFLARRQAAAAELAAVNPLAAFAAQVELADLSLWRRILAVQSVSGALIGATWYVVAAGIFALAM